MVWCQKPINNNSNVKAAANIKHADTYYWLTRARNNEITDINKAIFYFEKAQNELKQAEKSPANDRLERKIKKGLTATITQLDAVESEIHNYFPLFSLLPQLHWFAQVPFGNQRLASEISFRISRTCLAISLRSSASLLGASTLSSVRPFS